MPEAASVSDGADVTVGIPTRNRSGLLRKAIASVLCQRYPNFTVLVSDNASDDDTATVVASFSDSRLVYRPLERDIGRTANTNRLIELAETEFVVLLADDDELCPNHLSLTVDTLKRSPTLGVAQTGCAIVDVLGNTLVPHARLLKTRRPIVLESGAEFLERCMTSEWTVCFSSATFRRTALVGAGGLWSEDGVVDDLPLLMRMATEWDFAYVNRPLAVKRAHSEAASSSIGSFTRDGWRPSRSLPDILYEYRRTFLTEAGLPQVETRRLGRKARAKHLSMRAGIGERARVLFPELGQEIRRDPRLLLEPLTWRFIVGQLGGRRVRDGVRAALESARQRH
jgi:glycosyltransferase involved in cell wall biosynthesis